MKSFATLVETLDQTNKTNAKVDALSNYFKTCSKKDALWAVALLSHRRPPRPITTTIMRQWAAEVSQMPLWLFEESYHIVGDLAETIALLVKPNLTKTENTLSLHQCIEEIIALKAKSEEEKKTYIIAKWKKFSPIQAFVFNKILTGGFRIGVSQKLMTRALSKATGIEENTLAHRLMGQWTPLTTTFDKLLLHPDPKDQLSKPFPFCLAHAIEKDFSSHLNPKDWFFEHKWDGMRAQLIVRKNHLFLWSRGEELITDKFPEFESIKQKLPSGTVLDGEILPFKEQSIGHFNALQKRIGRKTVTQKLLKDIPVILMVYDILESKGEDLRAQPLEIRLQKLDSLFSELDLTHLPIKRSKVYCFDHWDAVARERERANEKRSEGLMVKHKESRYEVGRKKGLWWKWKSDPKTIDAVLTYAMRGHGRRTNLYTDYTFALWKNEELVTFAKAYSGLSDAELKEIDKFVKQNTLERFGPVRQVKPALVFEIAFEGIAPSSRHKSGVAVRFPRILRWRHDKKIEAANSIDDLKKLLP